MLKAFRLALIRSYAKITDKLKHQNTYTLYPSYKEDPAKILTDPPVLKKNKADSAITRHLKESTACLQPDVTKKI